MRTWLVQYPVGHEFHDWPEEVDGATLAEAEACAADLYAPGYTLVEIAPGGSGGMFQVWSS